MNIELTNGEQLKAAQQAVAATTLISCGLAQRFINAPDDGTGTIGRILGGLQRIEAEMLAYIQRGQTNRIAELQANIAEVCEQGRIAEQELAAANAGVMNARIGDANRENAYNTASMKLKTAQTTPLPRFYNAHDEAMKAEAILLAQAELDGALADMQMHPMAIPSAIQREQEAKRKVQALSARVAAYRAELVTLTGKAAQPTGTVPNGTGLAS
jgi:hypothetical protein